jgi:hypothetical protein
MKSAALDYVSADRPRSRGRWPWRALITTVIFLALVLSLPAITVRQIESRVDTVTGSMSWKTVWLFGFTSGPRVDMSPLELRLKNAGVQWTPSWHFLHNTHRNLLGGATCHECGSAPPIYRLRPLLGQFAAASTNTELREFVRVMQTGTEAEQKATVDAAVEKGLQSVPAERRGD